MAKATSTKSAKVAKKAGAKRVAAKPRLLSGGNPQIAKGYGNAPVQAYIAAMPGWKRDVGRRLDALIVRTVPDVRKAVKWNSPFYGVEGQGWFLSFHCFTKYVKVAFFRGASLRPVPPGESKQQEVRYLDIHEGDVLDEARLAKWIRQAAALPGWKRAVGERLDALIARSVPDVRKAVKWNSPFYGVEGQGWFLSFHCYTAFVKVAFFRGASLRPPPPVASKQPEVRYLDIREGVAIDEAQLADWIGQASALPGWTP